MSHVRKKCNILVNNFFIITLDAECVSGSFPLDKRKRKVDHEHREFFSSEVDSCFFSFWWVQCECFLHHLQEESCPSANLHRHHSRYRPGKREGEQSRTAFKCRVCVCKCERRREKNPAGGVQVMWRVSLEAYLQLEVQSLCWAAPATGSQADRWKPRCGESAGREPSCSTDSRPTWTRPRSCLTAQSRSALCAARSQKPTTDRRQTVSRRKNTCMFNHWDLTMWEPMLEMGQKTNVQLLFVFWVFCSAGHWTHRQVGWLVPTRCVSSYERMRRLWPQRESHGQHW